MKKIILILLTVFFTTLFSGCSENDLSIIKDKLKEYKIISNKPHELKTHDKIINRYVWGLITKKDNLLYITDSQGIKLNKTGFKQIKKFNEFNIAIVQNSE